MFICSLPCHSYMSNNLLCLCESKVQIWYPNGCVHTNPFGFFCGRCFLHFLLLLQSKLHQIEPLHANWLFTMLQLPPILHFKLYFFLSPFALFYYALLLFCQLFFFFARFPKYSIEVTTCDLE
jgi:hypothetical protein